MKILVTGGTGYIGSHTVVELQQKGHEVFIIDNLSNSEAVVVQRIAKITGREPHFEKIEMCDMASLDNYFASHNIFDGVIHFAAFKAVGESMQNPLKYYYNNLVSMTNLILCMQKYKIQNLVFSSSCTVYGQPDILPVTEESPVKPAYSPYGNTKQISEEIISDTISVSDLKAISLRYFNPIGAHESAEIGELPVGTPNNLIPYLTQTAIGKREVLSVFGNDYDTPDGTCIRDYIHVVDLAKAHVFAMNRLISVRDRNSYEVFNLGTGTGYSVLDVINAFENVTGIKLNYSIAGRRQGDVEKVWADTRKANDILGWKAEKTLEQMMKDAWNWELRLNENKY
jgi:UDP-glucose 4-epimerase